MSSKISKSTKLAYEKEMVTITGCSARDAQAMLSRHGYKLDAAIDAYYGEGPPAPPPAAGVSKDKLQRLFDVYKEADDNNLIGVDGTVRLCADLSVDPEDVVLLAVAFELKCPAIAEWTREGWVAGWTNLRCDTIEAMRNALGGLRTKLGNDAAYFQQVYAFTFEFAKQSGQRSLPVDMAESFWKLLIPHAIRGGVIASSPPWTVSQVAPWYEFLRETKVKGVSKDTWSMFLDFLKTVNPQLTNYEDDGAWPSIIDDFVVWAREKQKSS